MTAGDSRDGVLRQRGISRMSVRGRWGVRLVPLLLLTFVASVRRAAADEEGFTTWDLAADYGATNSNANDIGPEGAWSYGNDVFATNDLSGFRVYNDFSAGQWKFATDAGPAVATAGSDAFYSHETDTSARAAVSVWTAPRNMDIAFLIEAWTPADGVQNTREHDISWRLYDTDGTTLLQNATGIIGGSYQGHDYATRWTRRSLLSLHAGQMLSFWHSRRGVQGFVASNFFVTELAATSYLQDLGTLGGDYSHATGINASGTVVGSSRTADNATVHAFAYSDGVMTDLGALGGSYSEAVGINDNGQVAGSLRGPGATVNHAFIWSSSGGMRDIGTIGGPVNPFSAYSVGISSRGMVVGQCRRVDHSESRGFVWSDETGMLDIGRLSDDTDARALQANARGEVIGWSEGNSGSHAFLWSAGEGMTDLGSLGGVSAYPTGINDSGQIVGGSNRADGTWHAFLYSDGIMTDLGTLGGTYSQAEAINERGQVIGESTLSDGTYHAFLYSDGLMTDLGTLGGSRSGVTGINESGQVLGYSYVIYDVAYHAFAYSDGMMVDLGTFGGSYSWGTAINDRGQVAGYSYVAGDSAEHAFLAVIPDTAAPSVECPTDMTVEATSASGAVVTFAAATVTDAADPAPVVVVSPASGSMFPVGTTTVTVTATDASGNVGSCPFTVTVRDTTSPAVTCPSSATAEATGPAGAVVTFSAPTATDVVDGAVAVACDPASGSTFPLGTTTVTCTATDAAGNASAAVTFSVTVVDTTAPSIELPADVVAEATGAEGAITSFPVPTATDAVDGSPVVVCTPVSGSTFALGSTTVTCTSTDAAGNAAAPRTFTVTVVDTNAPTLACPGDMTAPTTSSAGAAVTFSGTASDAVTASPSITFEPASGSTFALGSTEVTCTATDAAGNASSCTFVVTVSMAGGAAESAALADKLASLPPIGNRKADKNVQKAIADLRDAADVSLWTDATHPTDRADGKVVFDSHQAAVRALLKISNPDSVVTGVIADIVALDRRIAQTALDDARARGGKAKKISNAQADFDAGVAAAAATDPLKASQKFQAAWRIALGA